MISRQRFFLFWLITPHHHRDMALDGMDELESLVATLGGHIVQKDIQHRVKPHPASYIGKGKLAELVEKVLAHDIDVLVFNDKLRAGQLYRIEREFWKHDKQVEIWDRIDLILAIFERHAKTKHAKLQIELARIQQLGPRNYGLGKDRLSRQGGGIGTRGLGETNVELEKRRDKTRMAAIRKQLRRIGRARRAIVDRRASMGMGPVALVGYTSAGKTTLFNVLTGKEKEEHAKLFTTLDTVVGKIKMSDQDRPVIVSDTIGFIRDLPPELIEAFASTLYESLSAELILHVIDIADPDLQMHIQVVEDILARLGVTTPILKIYTKADQLEINADPAQLDGLLVSAKTGVGIDALKQEILSRLL